MSAPCTAITGVAGTGKTDALLARLAAAPRSQARGHLLLAPSASAVTVLRERLGATSDVVPMTFGELAISLIREFETGKASVAQIADDAMAALGLQLSPNEIAALEEPYVPHPVLGFS